MIKLNVSDFIKSLQVYCDGACSGNPGRGGWGAIFIIDNHIIHQIKGANKHTTNNRMELLAAISALNEIQEIREKCKEIIIYTDSMYLKMGITTWIAKWRMNGWRSSSGVVKNIDLWQQLYSLCNKGVAITWQWVKAHSGNHYNEVADQLARQAINEM
ncbi:MAG: ribonuclease HI [Proteobacteria bacterium]|nr:ribonuclease HI [Pseudomonadota bacterium]